MFLSWVPLLFVFGLYGSNTNVHMSLPDNSEIFLGCNQKIDEKIRAALMQDKISAIYSAIPFYTKYLPDFLNVLKDKAANGTQVNLLFNTRVLKKEDVLNWVKDNPTMKVYNSTAVHDKEIIFINTSTDVTDLTVCGTVFIGSGNQGSLNAAKKNQEGWWVSSDSKKIEVSRQNFKQACSYAHFCDGSKIVYTPKKDKNKRQIELAKLRQERSFHTDDESVIYSTYNTELLETRKKILQRPDVESVYIESMTFSSPKEMLSRISEKAAVSVVVDHTAITTHNEHEWRDIASKPGVKIAVRTSSSSSHHVKLAATKNT